MTQVSDYKTNITKRISDLELTVEINRKKSGKNFFNQIGKKVEKTFSLSIFFLLRQEWLRPQEKLKNQTSDFEYDY